jgi:protein-S-isoprenylcysteine O-methyltransferase Ste14
LKPTGKTRKPTCEPAHLIKIGFLSIEASHKKRKRLAPMIISLPTEQGMITFALNASMLKLIALAASVLMLLTGYVAVQLATFILDCTPQEFLRIVIFTTFTVGIVLFIRFLLNKWNGARI